MTLERAIEIKEMLREELESARALAEGLGPRRAELAFAAHTGDTAAKAELDKLNADRLRTVIVGETLEMALAEAERRVEAAKADAEAEAQRAKARDCREIAATAGARGAKIAEAARTLRDEIMRLDEELERMRLLGAPIANGRLVFLALTRSITPLLREAGLIGIDIVPPGHRHDIDELVTGYVGAAEAWAAKLLDGAAAAEAEAA